MSSYSDTPHQTQYITGTSGDDEFVISGLSTDYRWHVSSDSGKTYVWGKTGCDVLSGIEAIRFDDAIIRPFSDGGYSREILQIYDGSTYTNRAGWFDRVNGTPGEDVFVINASASDYSWSLARDGQSIRVAGDHDVNYLRNVETIRFNDLLVTFDGKNFTTLPLDNTDDLDVPDAGDDAGISPMPGQYDFDLDRQRDTFRGTGSENDTFIIDGESDRYHWSRTWDGDGVVVRGPDGTSTLYDVEYVRFNDITLQFHGHYPYFTSEPTVDAVTTETDHVIAVENTAVTLSMATLLANDASTVSGFSNPQVADWQGSVSIDNQGNLIFTPVSGFNGVAKIFYEVTDDRGAVGFSTLNVTVKAQGDTLTESLADINGENGFAVTGANAYDYAGSDVSAAGDINGDGYADFIVFAEGVDGASRHESGQSYVVFGSASQDPGLSLDTLDGNNGFAIAGTGGYRHLEVQGVGDINADGFDDIAITGEGNRYTSSGNSWIVYGDDDGFDASLDVSSLDGSNGFAVTSTRDNTTTNRYHRDNGTDAIWDLEGGDFNGDGIGDLLAMSGNQVRVVYGDSDGFGSSLDLANLDGSNGFTLTTNSSRNSIGYATSAGDLNGDGTDDLVVYDRYNNQLQVVYGSDSDNTDATLYLDDLDSSRGFDIQLSRQYGVDITRGGDLNGDGYDDLVLANGRGQAQVIYGSEQGSDLNLGSMTSTQGATLSGMTISNVAAVGDVNGDGLDDLALSNQWFDGTERNSGVTRVLYGDREGFGSTLDLGNLSSSQGRELGGASAFDQSGSSISGVGDVNGDGFDDLLIGADLADANGNNSGTAYVVYGQAVIASDALTGTSGDDWMVGGNGDESFSGLGGADRFIVSEGNDVITDFLFSEGDVLDFSSMLPGDDATGLDNAVSVSQSGSNAVLTTVTDNGISTLILEAVDLSAFDNASDLLAAGYINV